ncbi:hypothetical protein ACWT_5871 [Actinoplanes sp. SE50]|uniref:hypothetical protein n=1 Tax=unclassified Actinoplanes TaxID=2626549 RepID=UPI00023EBDDB|nr:MULTISPECIES: hypothetical protein [unclassified Actinoplanes]AEV86889.1 hypothetical protein ACPL_6002 [Actinoplanes sp. SE50/110]ATO85286.1 hypothetical protein ACWT_5871 [Actinoplanes sp. SE50]SLM02696.1 hypothetical protein ACSP50_5978 [Actinoplanes sp. SE50/110]
MPDTDLTARLHRLLHLYRALPDDRIVLAAIVGDDADTLTLGDLRELARLVGA